MSRVFEVRCTDPNRRDALEEAARLTLAFVAVSARPGGTRLWKDGQLRLVLSVKALHNGCYLAEAAQDLLEALQSYGVPVTKLEQEQDPPKEWEQWWKALPPATDSPQAETVIELT